MALRLRGATSGYIELKAPASAGDNTLTLPTNNGGANQLLKIDGSGNLSWQSNLTYDGSYLSIATDAHGEGLKITSSADTYNGIIFDANRSGADAYMGAIEAKWNGNLVSFISFETGDDTTNKDDGLISFSTRESGQSIAERIRIETTGYVGIGTSSPGNLVHIEKSHADPLVVIKNTSGQQNEGACLKLWASGRGSGIDDEDILLISDSNNARNFGVSNAGTINTTGNIKMANGKGIDFSATANGTGSAQDELFDDYEEGTWTPAYDTSGSTGAISNVSYATQVGRYVKIGRVVYLEGVLKTSAITVDTSGTYDIGGMPFTAATGTAIGSVFTYLQSNWSNAPRSFDAVAGTTRMRARQGIDVGDGSYTQGSTNDFQTNAGDKNRIYFSGHYRV